MTDYKDTSAGNVFDDALAEAQFTELGCPADEIVLRLCSDDALPMGWGGIVSQKAGACAKYFAQDESYWLLFVNQGEMRLRVDDDVYDVGSGDTLLILPHETCIGAEPNKTAVQWHWLAFKVSRSRRRYRPVSIEVPRVCKVPDPARVLDLFRVIIEEFHSHQRVTESDRELDTQGAHLLLMSLLARLKPSQEESLPPNAITALAEKAKDYIRTNLSNSITTSEIANALECSEGYLGTAFRKTYAESPGSYIARTRISISRNLLAETRQSISEVARECGFENANYFTRIFKKYVGMTPSEYRITHSHLYITTDI